MNRRGVKFTLLPLKKPRLIRVNLNYNQCATITKLIIECPVKNYNLQGFEKKKINQCILSVPLLDAPPVLFCKKGALQSLTLLTGKHLH